LLFVLADYYNDEEERAWPSTGRLSKEVMINPRSVLRLLRKLEERGIIETEHRKRDDGGFKSSNYRFCALKSTDVHPVSSSNTPSDPVSPPPDPQDTPHPTRGSGPSDTGVGTHPTGVTGHEPLENRHSSSSSLDEEDEEEFLRDLQAWYTGLARRLPGLRSPLRAPGRYFQEIHKNGDIPSYFSISSAEAACQRVQEALTQDHEDGRVKNMKFTVPGPTNLDGMLDVCEALEKWDPSRETVRMAVFNFVRHDDENLEPEIEVEHLLTRIARHPEKFVTAIENAARES